jgi:hypothetical protein
MNPDVPSAKAPYLIIELQAMSTKFSMMASVYSTIAKDKAGSVNNNKKNIYYSAKEAFSNGSKGQLDVDANAGSDKRLDPQENIFWKTNPPSGIYKIIVVHYSEKQYKEVPFILSLISQKGKSKIIYSKVHHDNFKCMLVAEMRYLRGQGITEVKVKKSITSV